MDETGQFSRALNKVFTPITHPLLPIIAAPGQLSAAEINGALSSLGQLPKKSIYGITTPSSRMGTPHAPFYEKCFNELGLPHQFAVVESQTKGPSGIEGWCNRRSFGGAYLSPPVSLSSLMQNSTFFSKLGNGSGPTLTEAARMIGMVDTIVVQSLPTSTPASTPPSAPSSPHGRTDSPFNPVPNSVYGLPATSSLVFDNAGWRGILSTLTRDLAPSAYAGRTAIVLASSSDDAASTMYALKALRVGKVYTVGFKTPLVLARGLAVEPFHSLESLQRARTAGEEASPFVIVSALGPDKSSIAGMLVRVFGGGGGGGGGGCSTTRSYQPSSRTMTTTTTTQIRKVFLDLADFGGGPGRRGRGDPGAVAEQSGFAAYTNVPYSFVRLASGQGMF
ncbi:hypothetical protein GGR56DRAFT_679233 [Xylariaceae sp. FL0804]|nr:hypothetical protein GGR56DRAFT_679233 [Xylariaceae sp. FL0804]